LLTAHVEFEIVCESVNGWGVISKTAELQPDVILLDINLPDMNGLDVARWMIAPSAEILLLSEHDLLPMVQEGLRAGARGYVMKSDARDELATAIRQVHKKEHYVGLRFGALAKMKKACQRPIRLLSEVSRIDRGVGLAEADQSVGGG